jgi:sn1-specific diacylglycerol lipase
LQDIAAALILLYSQPEEAISLESASDGDDLEMPCQVITHDVSATSASADDILAWDNPAVVRHFMSYAGASYGYTWFHMRVASCRPCRLYKHIRCCACCLCFHEQGFIEADNCFSCNTAALRTTLPHLDDESIVHISFKNKLMEVPYFVAVDHTYKKIVISIRGTLSLEDALTDLCAKPESMASFDENLSGYLAHAGMLRAAQYVFAELRSKNILNKAFSYFDGYELCVVGHSLGAGTAVILSFLLRQFHPSLRCYAFSPPGGLLNEAAAKESEKFVVSIIVGKDLVPRLSFQSLTLLKERMKDVLKSCPLPKYQILATGLYSCCVKDTTQSLVRSRTEAVSGRSSSGESVDSSDPILRHEADSQSQPQYESLTDIYAQQQRRQSQSQIPFLHRMILPGRIFHLEQKSERSFDLCIKDASCFQEILVSPNMLTDHLPNVVYDVLCAITGHFNEV